MDKRCIGCKNFTTDNFCGYIAECCQIYGIIDCNPDNILKTFKGPCPMYNKDKKVEPKLYKCENNIPFKDF